MPEATATTVVRGPVGIDVGGTFTDAVLVDRGRLRVAKVRSTPQDLTEGFLGGLDELGDGATVAPSYLVHGTTIATNAIVQRALAVTGLITNRGFRDILEIGTQMRPRVYDLWTPLPPSLVARRRCVEVGGRLAPDGTEVEPLDPADVRRAAEQLHAEGVESVAVVLLFSFVDGRHERRLAELLAEHLPDLPVTLSSVVAPEYREYLRASTTVLNAALLPLVGGYVGRLSRELADRGISSPLHLMQSNGGVATATGAARLPVGLAASGPAAGVIGAARLAGRLGERDLLTLDMGGTTADVALIVDGLPQLRFTSEHNGHPVNVPQIEVLSVGAGGGSIAAVDAFGSLTVGPGSAGAVPGPACYGGGGVSATVTDAHAVQGTLHPRRALGGRVALDVAAAHEAVRRDVADPLGLAVQDAAAAIVRVADANMSAALRVVSVARGRDPRAMALVAFGGAGPMHACAIADELGSPRIVVPRHPGVTAALGLLLSDVRHDLRRSWFAAADEAIESPQALDRAIGELEREGRKLVAAGGRGGDAQIACELDMRYRGQAYNLTVPLKSRPVTAATVRAAADAFEEAHRRVYDYTPSVQEIDIVTVRVRATASAAAIDWEDGSAEPATSPHAAAAAREVWWQGTRRTVPVLDRAALCPGDGIAGPAIVEQEDSTVVIADRWTAQVVTGGMLLMTRNES
jgi:N-methylhydantoinase A